MTDDNIHSRHFRTGARARGSNTAAPTVAPRIDVRARELATRSEIRDPRVKVLVLIPTLRFGGAEMDLVRNLPRIDRRRFKFTVCAFLEQGQLARPLLDAGIKIIGPMLPPPRQLQRDRGRLKLLFAVLRHLKLAVMQLRGVRIASRHLASGLIYLHLARRVASYIRSENIDVVHAVLPNSYVVAAVAIALARRAKLVLSRVSLNWYHERLPLLGFLERRIFHRRIDMAICNTLAIREQLVAEGIPLESIRLIQNGIALPAFLPECGRSQARKEIGISDEALVFTSVANFYPYKGHADLLKALHLANDSFPPNWMLLAVGGDVDGYVNEVHAQCGALGLTRHVRFLGLRNDIEVILRASDIHISASHTEGLPNNVLEAMSASLPVVATAVGGVPDAVIDGRTGLLVPPKDPKRMAQALLLLAHDPDRRRSMGEAGRSLAGSSFSLERSVRAFEQVYAQVAEARKAGTISTTVRTP